MKKYLIALLVIAIIVIAASQSKNSDSIQSRWEQAMLIRKNVIEKKFGIKFNNGWVPKMEFKSSDTISHEIIFYNGRYVEETGTLRINERFRGANIPAVGDLVTKLPDSVCLLIDHELGHALTDQISHRLSGKTWPAETSFETYWEVIEIRILTEGVADFFRNMLSSDTTSSVKNLPNNSQDELWQTKKWIYDGGYWTVKPIIEKYGEKGIEYIINHLFHY